MAVGKASDCANDKGPGANQISAAAKGGRLRDLDCGNTSSISSGNRANYEQQSIDLPFMVTDQRTGVRAIIPAHETFAAVAIAGLTVATVLRCFAGRPGGIGGAILTLMALAVLSRFRISWDQNGISYQTPVYCWRKRWNELDSYSIYPECPTGSIRSPRNSRLGIAPRLSLRLHGRGAGLEISLRPFSSNDIRHLTDRVSKDLPLREEAAVVS